MPLSGAAGDALERLWAQATADADTSARVAGAAERVGAGLCTGLTRWIGSEGYQGLLLRALDEVRAEHPWMAHLRCEEGRLNGLAAATSGQPPAAVRAGMLALLVALARVLGRITGEEMAIRLMEQAWAMSEPEAVREEAPTIEKGTHDG
jgi:hypothetical protein